MDEEDDKEYPLWDRMLIAATVLGMGALGGGLIGAPWGSVLSIPVAVLGFVAPAALGWIMAVLQVFSCAS